MAIDKLLHPLRSTAPLIVYIDVKSPYAYLAIEPTIGLAEELGINIDWRLFVLDIQSYLGSAKLGKTGEVVASNRTSEQWSGVKYAYFDCRRYANLSGMTIRGTEKIWDTQLPAIGLLWLRQWTDPQISVRYIRALFEPFWRRALDVEELAVIERLLVAVGAPVEGFAEFAAGQGRAQNDQLQAAAFDAGIFGVPTYVLDEEIFFGREHLPMIRARLSSATAPMVGVDVAYELPPAPQLPAIGQGAHTAPAAVRELEVAIDFSSPSSLLALAPTLRLAQEFDLRLRWLPTSGGGLRRPAEVDPTEDRGQAHRRLRAAARARYLALYAAMNLPEPVTDLFVDVDPQLANAGLLWATRRAVTQQTKGEDAVHGYVQAVFNRVWFEQGSIQTVVEIDALLKELGVQGFAEFWHTEGEQALSANRLALSQRGLISAPTYFFADQPFVGREHLPLLRALLGALQVSD